MELEFNIYIESNIYIFIYYFTGIVNSVERYDNPYNYEIIVF